MVVKIKHSHHLENESQERVPNIIIVSVADTNALNVTFADDVVLTIEFDPQWFQGAYAPLVDADEFSTVEPIGTTLRWRCGVGICLTHLYSFALLGESVLLMASDSPMDALIRVPSWKEWEAVAAQVEDRLAPVFKALAAETTFPPIVTEADHKAAVDRLAAIFPPKPGTPQQHEADILVEMIEEWEKQHIPMPLSDPIRLIAYAMEERGLTVKDFAPVMTEDEAQRVLSRRTPLTLPMIRWAHTSLELPLESLIQDYPLASDQHLQA